MERSKETFTGQIKRGIERYLPWGVFGGVSLALIMKSHPFLAALGWGFVSGIVTDQAIHYNRQNPST